MRVGGAWGRLRARIALHWDEPQHRNASYLLLNTLTGAAVGVLFWVLLTRVAGLKEDHIGVGYATIALGTAVGLLAKGGLDMALMRTVPGASRREAARLLRYGIAVGVAAALLLTLVFALVVAVARWDTNVATPGWWLVAAIGVLLVTTWLQDAYFLAEGDARYIFQRNLVFSVARLLLPFAVIALALPHPVALTWALALAASAAAAALLARAFPWREGRTVPRREFLTSAARNVSGSAAEFLPGLLLAPFVFAMDGEEAAAYFGIAWTAASLLFFVSAALSRVATAEMVRNGHNGPGHAVRRGIVQHVWLVLPGALAGAALAPYLLSLFGASYAREGTDVMIILCLSTVVVAPAYLYLGVLRAQERPFALLAFPLAMVAALAVLAPLLESQYGLPGVALAWLGANLPFGAYAAWKLHHLSREVMPHRDAPTLHRAPHPE